jgi:glycosyltransferase involved in cell wall biosynthesis
MRLLVNALSARLGGGQTYLREWLRRTPSSVQVYLLCSTPQAFNDLPTQVTLIAKPALVNPFLRAAWERISLGALTRALAVDLAYFPGGVIACRMPCPTALAFQNMLPFDEAQRARYGFGYRRFRDWHLKRAMARSMRQADQVIFLSRFARDAIHARGIMPKREALIPHGVDARFFAPSPLMLPELTPLGYDLYVSTIDHYKAQIELVQAYAKLPNPLKLVLAGASYAPYLSALQQEISRLQLGERVMILGNVPHETLPALYQNARLNLFASRTENCPNILLEIMASGRPALVSNRGPMPEIGGDTVTYFDPDDVSSIASVWRQALQHLETHERKAQGAVERAQNFSWEQTARDTWQTLEAASRAA